MYGSVAFFCFRRHSVRKAVFYVFSICFRWFLYGNEKKGCNFVLPTSLELTKPRCRKTNKDKNIADKSAINYKK